MAGGGGGAGGRGGGCDAGGARPKRIRPGAAGGAGRPSAASTPDAVQSPCNLSRSGKEGNRSILFAIRLELEVRLQLLRELFEHRGHRRGAAAEQAERDAGGARLEEGA